MRCLSHVALAAAVLSAAACTASEPESQSGSVEEVRIGVLAPRTGQSQAAGLQALRGAELAAALVNGEERELPLAGVGAAGLAGLGGAKLAIVPADTQSKPAVGAAQAARLVGEERVVGLVGAYDTEVTEVASQRSERLGVPFVNGTDSAGYLTERGLDWFFRTGPTDRMFGEALFSTLRLTPDGAPKVAILYSDDRPGNIATAITRELASEGGFQLVEEVGVQPGAGSGPEAVERVRRRQPDAVFVVASTSADATGLLKAFGQAGYTPPGILAFGPGFLQPATLDAAGPDGEGLLSSTAWSREVAGRNPVARSVMELYEERFGQPMRAVAAGSFTAVLVLAKAIDDAGSIDPQRVRAALLNLDIAGREMIMPWTGVRFDASHQNAAATGVVEQRIDGASRVVFPDELGEQETAWPLSAARRP
jgi:branched-chain amino acid transport system substrate-binding protein